MKNRKLRTIEMNRISVEEFREAEKMPLIVVLDDVRSMYNIGSVFRTCDAFRVEAIYLCGITACPPHQEIHKTALGAEDSVSWRYFKTAQEAVEQLHQDGYYVWSVEQCEGSVKAPTPLQLPRGGAQESSPRGGLEGVAVIFGNEVKGVHQEVIDMSDGCLEIPQFGTKHSMNVSVTAGIVIWEFARQFLFSAE
jgi:tRNA G18 (ribose-2'-O)-methylase SpoU